MKRSIALLLILAMMIATLSACKTASSESAIIWREVPISEEQTIKSVSIADFDLREIIADSSYVFSGKVIGIKEFEMEWVNENGEQQGPFSSSIIEVKIDQEYHGESPVDGNIIKVFYPHSTATAFASAFRIENNSEYVFMTEVLDEKYVERMKELAPNNTNGPENYADVALHDTYYRLMPVKNEYVCMNRGYFDWNEEVVQQVKSPNAIYSDNIESSSELGNLFALDRNNFEKEFPKLFENPDTLPTVSDAEQLEEQKDIESIPVK